MNKFKITVDGDALRQHNIEILKEAIFNLNDDTNSFIILDPKTPINNSIYLQAAMQGNQYIAETRLVFDSPNNFKHYTKTYNTKEELFDIVANYYEREQLPDIRDWFDETNNYLEIEFVDDEMVKLYKSHLNNTEYFEVWLNDDGVSLTIHTGNVGDTGQTEDVFYDEEGDLPVKVAMNQLVLAQKEKGFHSVNLIELVVQYISKEKESITEKDAVEILLNESLGWTGNGHCEGGHAEAGIVNLFCYVVDKDVAVDTIRKAFEENGLSKNLTIAYADEKTEEYISLYPTQGESFDLF